MSSPADPPASRRVAIAYGALVVLAGLNLRAPITSVSAILGPVADYYGLHGVATAVLTSLPVLLLAAGAPLAPLIERRLGAERAVLLLAVVLAASVALRPVGVVSLFIGTIVAGAGISGVSVITPQIVRERFGDRVGLWSGVFSTSFGVSAAIGAGWTVPLLDATGSVPLALAAWALPALALIVLAAIVAGRAARPRPETTGDHVRLRPSALLWQVTVFFGTQALVFFAVVGWLPTVLADRGLPEAQGAQLLAWTSIAGLPASLLFPVLAGRMRRQHWLVVLAAVGTAVGLAGVMFAPLALAAFAVAVLGLSLGAAFGLGVALIVIKAPTHAVAGFSAVAQGAGYAIAALGPLFMGVFRAAGISWDLAAVVLGVVLAAEAIGGWMAGRHILAPVPSSEGKVTDSMAGV
jgi:CP family cyanate transporter-like MFS transporter